MKKIQKIDLKQKMIASLVTCVLIINFILPPRSKAIVSEVADTFQSLVCWIDDAIINLLQDKFIGGKAIYNSYDSYNEYQKEINEQNLANAEGAIETTLAIFAEGMSVFPFMKNIQGRISGDYAEWKKNWKGPIVLIQYSVAGIVSNQIPAFDVNFFTGGNDRVSTDNDKVNNAEKLKEELQKTKSELMPVLEDYNNLISNGQDVDDKFKEKWNAAFENTGFVTSWSQFDDRNALEEVWKENNETTCDQFSQLVSNYSSTDIVFSWSMVDEWNKYFSSGTGVNKSEWESLFDDAISQIENYKGSLTTTKKSSANVLKPIVQKWYYAFRNLALVALLSILLYLGIKIVLSSTAGEKAKHKENIQNWLMAVVLLFSLHYIMSFTLSIIDEINGALKESINVKSEQVANQGTVQKDANVEYSDYDLLMGNIRVAAEKAEGYTDNLSYTLMYSVLVVYTIIFTIMYFKRTVTIVFLTIIAPLVAITYPIDKEKDGKAQAFDIWMKEYFFNALLQPIHLILYYVLVSSAQELVRDNPLYGIVAIGFMIPAENLIRKMFGMENVGKASSLTGFAGGALASSAVKKLKSAGSKSSSSNKVKSADGKESSENSNIRMSGLDDVFNSNNGSNSDTGSNSENSLGGLNNRSTNGGNGSNSSSRGTNGSNSSTNGSNSSSNQNRARRQESLMRRVKNKVDDKIESTPILRGGARVLKGKGVKLGKAAASGMIKTAAATAGGALGLASGIASGDFSKAIQSAATGAAAGLGGANLTIRGAKTLTSGVVDFGKNTKETYLKGYYGSDDEYQKNVVIPKLKAENEKDAQLRRKYRDAGIDMANSSGRAALYKNGYVNEKEILKALKIQQQTGISDKELVQDAILSKQLTKLSDADSIQKELISRLQNSGMQQQEAEANAARRIKNIKKMAGLS